MKRMCKLLAVVVASVMMLSTVVFANEGGTFTPGVFTGTGVGYGGAMTVEVEFSETEIIRVEVLEHRESVGFYALPFTQVPAQIVEHQTLAVDAITGATLSRWGVVMGVMDAVEQAGGDVRALMTPIQREARDPIYREVDVVIVGGGGAGATAAVSALEEGVDVLLLERTAALGGNTIVSGGGITMWNGVFTHLLETSETVPGQLDFLRTFLALDPADFHAGFDATLVTLQGQIEEYLAGDTSLQFDSIEMHIVQVYLGGVREELDGTPVYSLYEHVRVMAENSADVAMWLVEYHGAQWRPVLAEPLGAMWRRAVRPVTNNLVDIFDPLRNSINTLGGEIMFETNAQSLIVEDGAVVGVNAVMADGTPVTVRAGSVVLATGGFAYNRDMVANYNTFWNDFDPLVGSTNISAADGTGIIMAREIGADVIHMGLTQLLHTGFAATGHLSVSPGGANVMYVNDEGRRFVNERDERDIICSAAFALGTPGGSYWEIKRQQDEVFGQLDFVGDNTGRVFSGATLEELAANIGVPAENLIDEVARFNTFAEQAYDPDFGTAIFHNGITGPYMARRLAPATHYTMGGLLTTADTFVLDTAGNIIPNLFAAGEIMGGIHGGNRLGGNAIAEAFVFGKIAGVQAAANAR